MAHQVTKHDEAAVKSAFKKFDVNNNGKLSLAEIDKAVQELYPTLFADKRAMMRAYKAADNDKNQYINFSEFHHLVDLLYYFNDLGKQFAVLDKDHDHRISLKEFIQGHSILGLHVTDAQAKVEFDKIDTNHGGYILFDEFCTYMAKKKAVPK